jgi:hypothetical protein
MERYIFYDSNIVSSRYTGEHFSYEYNSDSNNVVVVFENKKKWIQFFLDKTYPYYAIYTDDEACIISGRKYQMKIK